MAGMTLVGVVASLMLTVSATAVQTATTELDLALCTPRQNTFSLNIVNTYDPLPVD
jgi:hypothetical protein